MKMHIHVGDYLFRFMQEENIPGEDVQLPDVALNTDSIKVIMINEVPPQNPEDYFYGKSTEPNYMKTTLQLFQDAGVTVRSMDDIIDLGIYITTAVKSPKTSYKLNHR